MDNLSVGIPSSLAIRQRAGGYPRLKISQQHPDPGASCRGGRDHLEPVVAIVWNGWSGSSGISGRHQLDSVVAITWNAHARVRGARLFSAVALLEEAASA
jgi:hypothetical protein